MSKPVPADDFQGATILVVDDDRITRQTLAQVLKKSSYHVVEAGDGREALRLMPELRPDLILLDVIMPELDGFETCRELRKRGDARLLPVLMLTGLDDVDSVDQAFQAGATDFITKPINWSLLGQRVRYALRDRGLYKQLQAQQKRLSQAQRIARLGYWDLFPDTRELYLSDELLRILELGDKHRHPLDHMLAIVHKDDREKVREIIERALRDKQAYDVEHRVVVASGQQLAVQNHGEAQFEPDGVGWRLIGTLQDITERKEAEALIERQAYFDSLTDLPNRHWFSERLGKLMDEEREDHLVGVLFLGLDRFKVINETMGHSAGDRLLREFTKRIEPITHEGDMLARFTGDVFAVIVPNATTVDEINVVARRLLHLTSRPFNIDEQELFLTASIGVSIYPLEARDRESIISAAEAAMSSAKKNGGNQYQYYSHEMNQQAMERMALERDMRKGLEAGQFIVYYQPQVDSHSKRIIGMEALVRWQHPTRGLIPPLKFIPIAEETGLIIELGHQVLLQACKQVQLWHEQGLGDLRVGVNLSARQLIRHDFVNEVQNILLHTRLDARLLDLEITESMAVQNLDATISILEKLKSLGVSASMDDFGTGYSALSYLQKLPIDILKIDRSFVKDINEQGDNGQLAKAIIAMAHSLGLSVIGEGVETKAQLDFLVQHGCNEIQGYFFSPPVSGEEFEALVRERNSVAA